MTALLELRGLEVVYNAGTKQALRAVAGVSFTVQQGHSMAVIGESGSGKSTIARAICGLAPIAAGEVLVEGKPLPTSDRGQDRATAAGAAGIQIVFQDPVSSLDPRWPAWKSVIEPRTRRVQASPAEHRAEGIRLLERVGLGETLAERRPHMLSGGQRQRVTIARALAAQPKLVILDEAVSALDVSVRNEILFLLEELKAERGLTYLLISHDMGAVAQMASEVAVLYLGKVVESGAARALIRNPVHPYTRALIAAVPTIAGGGHRQARAIGEVDDPAHPPPGCRFHRRCPFAIERCRSEEPAHREVAGRQVACHRAEETLEIPA